MRKQRPLNPLILLMLAVCAGVLGAGAQLLRSSLGSPPFVLPYTVAVTLGALAACVLAMGIWLRGRLRDEKKRVDPFQAVRILVTARASQITGSAFTGLAAGMLSVFIGREIAPHAEIWAPTLACLIAGVVLVIAGIVTENFCKVPPDDEDPADGSLSDGGGTGRAVVSGAQNRTADAYERGASE